MNNLRRLPESELTTAISVVQADFFAKLEDDYKRLLAIDAQLNALSDERAKVSRRLTDNLRRVNWIRLKESGLENGH